MTPSFRPLAQALQTSPASYLIPMPFDTHRLALITQSLSKDDRIDAQRLAELGLRMPEMLNAVQPCSLGIQCDRAVLKARETLVETRTKLINTARGTVKSFGKRCPDSSSEAFAKKARPEVPDDLRDALEPLLEVIQHVSDEIRCFDKRIEKLGAEKYPATKRLRSIAGPPSDARARTAKSTASQATPNGVGPVTALAFVLNLDNDPQRLRRSRDAGPRPGLRPKRRDSGERSPQLSITKSGDRMLRQLLVQCSQYILGHHGEDSILRRWGLGLAARGGPSAKRKAIVAVARKLAVLMHALWRQDVDFDPFYETNSRAAAGR